MKIANVTESRKDFLLAVFLLLGLLLFLLLPTMKAVRTVEIKPENQGVLVSGNQLIADYIQVPESRIDYVVLWVIEGHGDEKITPADYKNVKLQVASSLSSQNKLRTAEHPRYEIREGKPALVFHIKPLQVRMGERLDIYVQQEGSGRLLLEIPFADQIKSGEDVQAAFQLAERKNWITLLIDKIYAEKLNGNDIAMYLHRGQQILSGANPYSCVLEPDGCLGYPAHLPGMYWFASGLVLLGAVDLDAWTVVWRPISFASWLAVGTVLLVYIYRRKQPALAVAVFAFWLFNRWSLDVLRIAHTDFLGVLFLLIAVIFAERRPKTAALLFGLSLAVKQVALLALPFFLIWLWQKNKKSISALAIFTGLSILVPFISLLPFLITDAPATFHALLYPAERPAQIVHGFASSLAVFLGVTDISKLFIMVYLITMLYIGAWRKKIDLAGGMLMMFSIMISFTHVLYNQYVVWMLPFIPLTVSQVMNRTEFSRKATK